MVMAPPDASSLLGAQQTMTDNEMEQIRDMAAGEYRRNVKETGQRDYVTFYHPDGTTSVVQLPPMGKTGRGRNDRVQKITHYTMNKLKDGKRWWYASPPAGWKPSPMPWRCPVQECTRAGGLKDLLNLWRHITNKHPGEKELYAGVLKAIQERLAAEVSVDLNKLLIAGDDDTQLVVSEADLAAAKFEDAASVIEELEAMPPPVPLKTFEPNVKVMTCDCGWQTDKGKKSYNTHARWHCPLREKGG